MNGIIDNKYPVPTGHAQFLDDGFIILVAFAIGTQTVSFDFEGLGSFVKGLLERASDTHHLSYGFHLKPQSSVRTFELIEVPTWYFYDYVIQCRLEQGRSGLCDLVVQFVQRIPYRQFGRNFCNRVSRCLGSQSGRSGNPRVDLDGDNVLFFVRTYGELYITSSGEVPYTAHHVDGHIPHALERPIREGHCRRHGDGIPGVDTHGVHIFDGTDDDHVVVLVA